MKTIMFLIYKRSHVNLLLVFVLIFNINTVNAQLTGDTNSKINQTIAETANRVPLMGQMIEKLGLGTAAVLVDDGTTFKFKKVRSDILLSDVLKELNAIVGNPDISALLNNPIIEGVERVFKNSSITANYTVENTSTTPVYSVSLVGEALNLNFEFYFGSGEWHKDFILAIVPDKIDFTVIHESLALLNELPDYRGGIFLSQVSSNNTPRMEMLTDMGLDGYLLSSGLTCIGNINFGPDDEIGKALSINNLIGKVEIPDTPTKPLVFTASLKPEWDLGPHASISDFSLSLGLGVDDGKLKIETTAAFTLTTDLPSSLMEANKTSRVHWTMAGSLSAAPDESGVANLAMTASGKMVGEWKTPFGINEITLNGMGLDLTLNFEFKVVPGGVVVLVTPAAGVRGDVNIGKTGKINMSLAGAIDISTPYASGLYGNITNLGLGTILSEFHLNSLGNGISPEIITALDQVMIEQGEDEHFPNWCVYCRK